MDFLSKREKCLEISKIHLELTAPLIENYSIHRLNML